MMKSLTFTLNGERTRVEIEPGELLLDVLRRKLFLTGTKKGCGGGNAGPAQFCSTATPCFPACSRP